MRGHKVWLGTITLGMILGVTALVPRMFESTGAGAFTTPDSGFYVAVDCDASTVAIEDICNFPSGTTNITVRIVYGNVDTPEEDLAAVDYELITNELVLDPVATNNPLLNPALLGNWQCLPAPIPDQDSDPAIANSFLSCFWSGGDIQTVPVGTEVLTSTISYTVAGNGQAALSFGPGSFGNVIGTGNVDCPGPTCFGAMVNVGNPPTNTPTATNTTAPSTSTNTPTATNTTAPSTSTNTPTATNTTVPSTSTNTPTATNTPLPGVPTNTPTATSTNTAVPTSTHTATATNTSVAPTNTSTATNTAVPTNTHTPTATATAGGGNLTPQATRTATTRTPNASPSVTNQTQTPQPTATNTAVATATSTSTTTAGSATATRTPRNHNDDTSTPRATRTVVTSNTATRAATTVSTVLAGNVVPRPSGGAGAGVALPDTGNGGQTAGADWLVLLLSGLVLAGGGIAGAAAYQQRRK